MDFVEKLLLPIIAISCSGITYLIYRLYIAGGKHNKAIQLANGVLSNNLTNHGVSQYMSTISQMKKIPNRNGNWNNLKEVYTLVKRSHDVDEDLKTQLRVMLRLKGLNNI